MLNTDRLQTILGFTEAGLLSLSAFLYTALSSPDGFDWTSPILWIGCVMAVVRGVKGYYAAGIKVPVPNQ